MKRRFVITAMILLLLVGGYPGIAQEKTAPTSEAAEGLNLTAFGELFKGSETLQAFERAINDPEVGVNNLDLDDNNEVDFLTVTEEVTDDTHLVVIQDQLAKDQVQDVATIAVEKTGDNQVNLQIQGDEELYGANYYIVPADVYIYRWPIVGLMYRPAYRPYRTTISFGIFPRWYRPYRPVAAAVYHTRTVRFTTRATFAIARTPRVRTVHKVHYTPRRSTTVKRRTTVTHTRGGKTSVTHSTTVRSRRN